MGKVRFRGRDWVKFIFLDSNVDPGSTKDPGTCLKSRRPFELNSNTEPLFLAACWQDDAAELKPPIPKKQL